MVLSSLACLIRSLARVERNSYHDHHHAGSITIVEYE
jgi:hypothetical protein